MKSRNLWKLAIGLSLLSVPLAGGCLQENSNENAAQSTGALTASVQPVVYEQNQASTDAVGASEAAETIPADAPNLAEAQIQPISTNQPVPPKVKLSPAAAELARLAGSGVDQGVMMAYVTNSQSTFNLTAEEIIYLNDLGVPGPVVTAMIQRDQVLKEQGKNALLSSSPPVTSLPAPAPVQTEPAPAPTVSAPLTPPAEPPPAPPAEDVSYSTFYDSLAPYGTWVYVSGYGRCWRPTVVAVNPTWQPYYDCGHWVYSDCGWYWMSDYSWGWAPFHYGRWFRHGHWGWCWAPDVVWGPSWVSWRYTDAYCGWAPLPPGAYFSFGIGLTWHGRRVHDWDDCGLHADHYRFVGWRHFDDHHVHAYGAAPHEVNNIYRNSVVVNNITVNNNTVINHGISRDRVASATRHDIRPVAVRASATERVGTGRAERLAGNTLTVYRPTIPEREATRTGTGSRQVRGGSNAGGSAPSAISAPTAERTATSTRSTSGLNRDPRAAQRDTVSASSGTRTVPRGTSSQPPTVVNNSGTAPTRGSRPGSSVATPPSRPSSREVTTPTPAISQNSAGSTGSRSIVPMRSPNGNAAQGSGPTTSRTVTTPPSSTWRNADPGTRFERVQPPARNDTIRSSSAPSYQPPTRSAVEVPRYAPAPSYTTPSRQSAPDYRAPSRSSAPAYSAPSYSAPQRAYTPAPSYSAPSRPSSPAPSYSRPDPAPSRSYSPPPSYSRSESAPARSYSPPPSAPRSDPAPSRPAPSSNSGNDRSGGSRTR